MKWIAVVCGAAVLLLFAAAPDPAEERLQRHRNLGKAFYENPTTQAQAVEEFQKALALRPGSVTERLNYGLALLRAGKTKEGIAELERVQKADPKLPHSWFNLGIELKKLGEYDRALAQFERMVQLVPGEPVSHYNLGVLYKLAGKIPESIKEFETAARLNPNLSAPHFQLYNAYRQAGRREEAARELETFQALKKQQEGAAIPEDMEWSFYSEVYDSIDPKLSAEAPRAALRFQARRLAGAPAKGGRLAITDADGDSKADLLVWSTDGARLYRSGSVVVPGSGLGALKSVVAIAPADFNNDGLADLCIITGSGAALYTNAKGAYKKSPVVLTGGPFESAVWLDYDRDYDLDLFLLGPKSALFRNEGPAGFTNRTADFPFVQGHALEGAGFRVVADTKSIDLAVSYRDRGGVLYLDQLGGKYKATDLALPAGVRSLAAHDLNNDSWIDLAFGSGMLLNRAGRFEIVKAAWSGSLAVADLENAALSDVVSGGVVYRSGGLAQFDQANNTTGLIQGTEWASADFNLDGKADLAAVAADGSVHLLTNLTPSNNRWMRISLTGIKTAKLAPYSEVEVKAGVLYQKKIYHGLPLNFGLRGYSVAETVRITWPNGLIQNEIKQTAGLPKVFKEAQRLSGSCPIIWTWNGREFEYITDVLGVAPLGASAGDGKYFPVDHDEYVQIRGDSLQPVHGKLEVRITEELSEVAYIDKARLIAIDHAAETEIFTNDKFKGPPFPEFRLFGVNRRVYPKSARDHRGRDVLSRIVSHDKQYPDDFSRSVSGVAARHNLDLDFGSGAGDVLVLRGWVDWADGSTFLGAAQEGAGLVPPYLQVKDAAGRWKTVIEDMGMPAGKPKAIVVDLTGKWLSKSREVRIVTNLCVYWDEIFLSADAFAPDVLLTALDPSTAALRFRGFSLAQIHPERKQPEMFYYAKSFPASMWNPTPGMYTRFGDVRELLAEADDRYAIMGSGDELKLLFDETALPPLKPGWWRDYLLLIDGWAKDRDPNTAHSQTVEPLPFHGMTRYPYSQEQRYPESPAHLRYRQEYNTRPALRLIRPLAARGPAE